MSEGLDVYGRYNTITSWSQVNGAKDFVYIKVTDGMTTANGVGRTYDYGYVASARGSGLPTGGYHYAQLGNAVQQANFFIDRCVALGATDLAPLLDLESPFVANQTATDFAIAFLNQVRARGFKPALYGNNSMLSVVRAPVKAAIPETIIVVARYGANPTVPYDDWQFTSSGTCPGVVGSVDLDTGIVPLNHAGVDMPLANPDFAYLLYNNAIQEFGNLSQLLNDIKTNARNAATSGAANATALVNLANLVIADTNNDLTAQQLADSLKPALLPDLEQAITDAITAQADVTLTPEQITAISNGVITAFGAKLTGV